MTIREIEQAASRLSSVIHRTPVSSSGTFSQMSGAELYLKCENLQKTGSFKVRGAYNKIAQLVQQGGISQVVASSAGNHAQGVAYASSALGIQSTIVMPSGAPLAKIAATEGYGSQVVLFGDCYDDAYQKALELQETTGAVFVHPFDDEDVIAGQGTIALEILRDLPTVDAILVPAGGGGLLAGVALGIKQVNPRIQVIGVQAQGADAIVQSFNAHQYIATDSSKTIADGIAVRAPGQITTQLIGQYVDRMVTVSDDEIAEAILLLLERTKLVVEPAGAASLAAAINRKVDLSGKRVVCLLSGGNIDMGFIQKIVERGLVARGRQLQFHTVLPDTPGTLCSLTGLLGQAGANIIMLQHDRRHSDLHLGETVIQVACEVGGSEHGQKVLQLLRKNGYQVVLE
ncbi:MAG TPA: threonine ammonia-lyase [Candidatus Anaerotruncus excrementipullorum]|uniref:L-threonine dehydratase catabolic TdcB n=1 Tax=Candidatus Anaerotruncus excrementipullorum TaxID=2838465 RepID=A0A9D1WSL5_9FIRM|nr:threonine ammonia-lyase [Candidatus Anaerotruncus excrementipullorum]